MSQSNELGIRDRNDPSRVTAAYGYLDEETGEIIPDKGRTKQEFAKDGDINNIIQNVLRTGVSDWIDNHDAWVKGTADVTVPNIDYKELMDRLAEAEQKFMELPSAVRAGFDNDPAQFMDFVQGEGGDIEITELIAKAKPVVKKAGSVQEASKPKEEPEVKADVKVDPPPSGDES